MYKRCVHLPVPTSSDIPTNRIYVRYECAIVKPSSDTMKSGRVFIVCTGFLLFLQLSLILAHFLCSEMCLCANRCHCALKERSLVYFQSANVFCVCARSEKRQICITLNGISVVSVALLSFRLALKVFQFPYCHCLATLFSHFIAHTL